MTNFADNPENFCYKHKNEQSFTLCQRCGRTICPDCQTPAAVGVVCPECMKEQRKNATPQQRRAASMSRLNTKELPPVTASIVGLTTLVGLLQVITGLFAQGSDPVTNKLALNSALLFPQFGYTNFPEVWRVLSYALVHGGILHFVFNMFFLYVIGGQLERMLGRGWYACLYGLGALGGAVAVTLLSPGTWVVGASGAIFAMLGAMLIVGWKNGQNMTSLLVLLGLNLVIGFVPGISVSWQGHIGGALAGMAVAAIFWATRDTKQHKRRLVLLIVLAVAMLLAIWLLGPIAAVQGWGW